MSNQNLINIIYHNHTVKNQKTITKITNITNQSNTKKPTKKINPTPNQPIITNQSKPEHQSNTKSTANTKKPTPTNPTNQSKSNKPKTKNQLKNFSINWKLDSSRLNNSLKTSSISITVTVT